MEMGRTCDVHVDEFESIDSWPHLTHLARPLPFVSPPYPLPCPFATRALSINVESIRLQFLGNFRMWCHPHDMAETRTTLVLSQTKRKSRHAGPPQVPFALLCCDPNRFKLCHTLSLTPRVAPSFIAWALTDFYGHPELLQFSLLSSLMANACPVYYLPLFLSRLTAHC